jgi:hypothetical protein
MMSDDHRLALYDGRECVGHIVKERCGRYAAYSYEAETERLRFLGEYPNQLLAMESLQNCIKKTKIPPRALT